MTSEDLYRILLKVYPVGFRREYEEAMLQCFRDQMRASKTMHQRVRLCFRTLADLARSVPARHLDCLLPRHGNFRFSDSARQALFCARHEASSFSRAEISLEHLLLGVLRNDREAAATLLGPAGIEAIVQAIEAHEPNARRTPSHEDLALSQECKAVITRAGRAVAGSGASVTTSHLLTAILHQDSSVAARLLREHRRFKSAE